VTGESSSECACWRSDIDHLPRFVATEQSTKCQTKRTKHNLDEAHAVAHTATSTIIGDSKQSQPGKCISLRVPYRQVT
jgi:hypothetical protein